MTKNFDNFPVLERQNTTRLAANLLFKISAAPLSKKEKTIIIKIRNWRLRSGGRRKVGLLT